MKVYLNDRMVPSADATVSVFDHGLLYGDGIYETMRVYGGVVFKVGEHMDRLERSASSIGMALPKDRIDTINAIYETIRSNSLLEAALRVTVTRGAGPLGLDPALCEKPTFIIIANEFREYPDEYFKKGLRLIIPATRRNLREALDPKVKSLNFLNNIMAKKEAIEAGAFDALMLNAGGMLTECTVSNVFFAKKGTLFTPSPECGILEGITRATVIALAREKGIPVIEGEFREGDIRGAEEVFITNTSLEVAPISAIDETTYPVGRISSALRDAYKREVKKYISDLKGKH